MTTDLSPTPPPFTVTPQPSSDGSGRLRGDVSADRLLPEHPNLWVRWFVQYNPLFTASALLVLAGVFLVSRAVAADSSAVLVVDAVVDVYQWLLIGTAALLYRRLLERRPAVFLGVIALVFLADPTLELSALSSRDDAFAAVCVFVVSFALKLRALAWAFRLTLSPLAGAMPILVVAVIALLQASRADAVDTGVAAAIAAVVAFAIAATTSTWTVTSQQTLTEQSQLVFARVVKAAVGIGLVGAGYQLINVGLEDPAVTAIVVVAVVAGRAAVAIDTGAAYALTIASFAVALMAGKEHMHLTLALVAAGMALASRRQAPLFMTGAIGLFAVIGYDITRWTPDTWVAVIALALIGWSINVIARRAWSSIPPVVVVGLATAHRVGLRLPTEGLTWGIALVGAGFVLLPLGVIVHRKLSRLVDAEDALRDLQAQATAQSPTSPAAF